MRKQGKNDTSKHFRVRQFVVQNALTWLKNHNAAYSDIIICSERLKSFPVDGECNEIPTVAFCEDTVHQKDQGPASEQTDPGVTDGTTHSNSFSRPTT